MDWLIFNFASLHIQICFHHKLVVLVLSLKDSRTVIVRNLSGYRESRSVRKEKTRSKGTGAYCSFCSRSDLKNYYPLDAMLIHHSQYKATGMGQLGVSIWKWNIWWYIYLYYRRKKEYCEWPSQLMYATYNSNNNIIVVKRTPKKNSELTKWSAPIWLDSSEHLHTQVS